MCYMNPHQTPKMQIARLCGHMWATMHSRPFLRQIRGEHKSVQMLANYKLESFVSHFFQKNVGKNLWQAKLPESILACGEVEPYALRNNLAYVPKMGCSKPPRDFTEPQSAPKILCTVSTFITSMTFFVLVY